MTLQCIIMVWNILDAKKLDHLYDFWQNREKTFELTYWLDSRLYIVQAGAH